MDSFTKLLLHCDGANASTTFTDEMGKATTAYGNAQISTSVKKLGTGSGLFDGNGDDYVSTPASADFDFGSGDFTVEAFIYVTTFASVYSTIIVTATLASRSWGVGIRDTNKLDFYWTTNGTTDKYTYGSYSFNTSTWYHVAITRTGGKIYFFVDGTLLNAGGTTFTDTIYNSNQATVIGRFGDYTATSHTFKGNIDELRISKGIARWTANFTPPVYPYGNKAGNFFAMF